MIKEWRIVIGWRKHIWTFLCVVTIGYMIFFNIILARKYPSRRYGSAQLSTLENTKNSNHDVIDDVDIVSIERSRRRSSSEESHVEEPEYKLQLPPEVEARTNSTEPRLAYTQQRDFPLLTDLDAEFDAAKHRIFLLLAIKSQVGMRERRDVIRVTWGDERWALRELGVAVRRVFLLGVDSSSTPSTARGEHALHGDILQWDFVDAYANLTLKEVLFMGWFARRCGDDAIPFVYDGDDDVFVVTRNLVRYLRAREGVRGLILGSRLTERWRRPRITDPKSKYFVSYNLYPNRTYPVYVSGGGFVMSGDLVQRLYSASYRVRMFPMADAFVGTLLPLVGVRPEHEPRFKSWGVADANACRVMGVFTFHGATPQVTLTLWWRLQVLHSLADAGTNCTDAYYGRDV